MKKINQADVARFLGISPAMVCEIKHNRKKFSRDNALRISALTGIPFDTLMLEDGVFLVKMLMVEISKKMKPRKRAPGKKKVEL